MAFSTHSISGLLALGMLRSSFRKEREQVLAHSELFIGAPWHAKINSHQWCEAASVRHDDSDAYIDLIAANLAGKNPKAFTLAAVDKGSNKLAGYILCTLSDDCPQTLMVGHLKVDADFQRRGVGSMLLAAGEIHANQRGWQCRKARLAVLAANGPAIRCYEKAGFRPVASKNIKLAKGVKQSLKWLQMTRSFETKLKSRACR